VQAKSTTIGYYVLFSDKNRQAKDVYFWYEHDKDLLREKALSELCTQAI